MNIFETAAHIAILLLTISIALTLVRFVKGPTLPDRVVALDVFSANLLAVLAIYSVISEQRTYLNVALTMSLVTLVGTMTFAYYLVQKRKFKSDDH